MNVIRVSVRGFCGQIQSRRGGSKGNVAVAMAELLKGLRDGEVRGLGVSSVVRE